MRIVLLIAFASLALAQEAGSLACARCHASIYRSFMQTPMARSSGRAGSGPESNNERFDKAEFRDAYGKFTYRVGQNAKTYYFEFQQQGSRQPIRGRRDIEYFVGSGNAARSYVVNEGGFLYEAPVAYYRNSASWKLPPGFEVLDYPYLTRPILPGCLQCHASGPRLKAGTQNAYENPPFQEGGVACERCHGSGAAHIASGAPMVNPAKLAPAARDSICNQCHLSGEIRVPKPGKDFIALRPGDSLADYLTVFTRAGSSEQLRVTSHAENLAQSACKRASGDKLWCGTCHDPHTLPEESQKASYFRGKCLGCHQPSDCNAPQASRQARGDSCVICHMQRNPTADVEHVVFTDHSIRKRPVQATTPSVTSDLIPYPGSRSEQRDLALAYATVGSREGNKVYLDRAFDLLRQVEAQGNADAQALGYLAELYRNRRDDAHALPLYEKVAQMDPSHYAAIAALGAYRMQRGDYEGAAVYWNRTLSIYPSLPLVRLNLANALLKLERPSDARAELERALHFNPLLQEARDLLNRMPPR